MRCRSCGYEMPEGSKFCENCGAKVETEPVSPAVVEVPEAKAEPVSPAVPAAGEAPKSGASAPAAPASKPKVKYVYKLPDKKTAKAKGESGKRSFKPLFILIAVIVVIAALLLIIKPWKGGKASASNVAKAYNAYYSVIMEKKDLIDGYTWQRDYSDSQYKEISRPVVFRDICGNEIPELILVRKDPESEKNAAILEIYTYEKGAAKLLLSAPWDKDPGLGFKYCLYQEEGDKTLKAFISEGYGGYLFETFISFAETKDGLQMQEDAGRSTAKTDSGLIDSFQSGGNTIKEEEYKKIRETKTGSMDDPLMYSVGCEYLVEEAIADNSIPSETAAEAAAHALGIAGPASGASSKNKTFISPADAPESLKSFLFNFYAWYSDTSGTCEYNCRNAADGTSNILFEIVGNGSCVNIRLYPGGYTVNHWEMKDTDPRGWNRQGGLTAFAEHGGAGVDWVAKSIFNVSDKDIETLKKQGEENKQFYIETAADGSYVYYNLIGGVGDPFMDIAVAEILFDGEKYTVSYDILSLEYSKYGNASYKYRDTCVAVMEYKEIDGIAYWSMYSNTHSAPEPLQTEEPAAAKDLFAQMPKNFTFTSGVGGWGTVITVNDDGTFTGSYSDHDYGDSGDGYDATLYVSEFSGRFTDPVKINGYTYSFKLADLQYQTGPAGETKIVTDDYGTRIREISSLAYGIDGGETFYYYTKGAPVFRLSDDFLQWMYMPMPSARVTHYLPYPGLYNETQKCGFYTFAE